MGKKEDNITSRKACKVQAGGQEAGQQACSLVRLEHGVRDDEERRLLEQHHFVRLSDLSARPAGRPLQSASAPTPSARLRLRTRQNLVSCFSSFCTLGTSA